MLIWSMVNLSYLFAFSAGGGGVKLFLVTPVSTLGCGRTLQVNELRLFSLCIFIKILIKQATKVVLFKLVTSCLVNIF